ncbi:hypothetical protein D3C81_1514500 [compost metagenome]
MHGHRDFIDAYILVRIQAVLTQDVARDGFPLDAGQGAYALAFQVLERRNGRCIRNDQAIVDHADLDAAALQTKDLEGARITRFGQRCDACRRPRWPEVGLAGYQ